MHVEHFMTKNPIACDVNDTVEDVAREMRDKKIGSVVVCDGDKVCGIVTDRQLAVDVIGAGKPLDTPIGEVMTDSPEKLSLNDNLITAVDAFRRGGRARRLPVVNDRDELVGIVSLSDIAVLARDLVDAIMAEEIHHSTREARIPTGGKRLLQQIPRSRRPRVAGGMMREVFQGDGAARRLALAPIVMAALAVGGFVVRRVMANRAEQAAWDSGEYEGGGSRRGKGSRRRGAGLDYGAGEQGRGGYSTPVAP